MVAGRRPSQALGRVWRARTAQSFINKIFMCLRPGEDCSEYLTLLTLGSCVIMVFTPFVCDNISNEKVPAAFRTPYVAHRTLLQYLQDMLTSGQSDNSVNNNLPAAPSTYGQVNSPLPVKYCNLSGISVCRFATLSTAF